MIHCGPNRAPICFWTGVNLQATQSMIVSGDLLLITLII